VRSGRGAGQPRRPSASFASVSSRRSLPGALEVWLGGMAPASLERCGAWPTLAAAMCTPARWWPVGRHRRAAERPGVPSVRAFRVSIATPPPLSDHARAASGRPGEPARGLSRSASSNCARTSSPSSRSAFQIRGQALVPPADWQRSSRRSPMRSATSRPSHSARAAFLSRMSRKSHSTAATRLLGLLASIAAVGHAW